ncbi:hypothetical protein Vadar_030353 [Vaccinium darrowii]|uniref:Uncharacterized protein n=1 Tax=Vaccinium darrowii TaxID=229202 RepID=A0ACB7ZQ03_9ERIC|nr:hypothetical protein Vadar_030353 [Vaccinium darrowii]
MEGEVRLQIASADHYQNHRHHITEDDLIEILIRSKTHKGCLLLQHFNDDAKQYGYALFLDPTLSSVEYHDINHLNQTSDPLIDEDCKLVLIQKFENSWLRGVHYDDYEDRERVDAMLYTLSTNSWRHLDGLESLPHGNFLSSSSSHMYLNGVYYWLAEYGFDMDYSCAVIAFDMRKEVFREISGPPIPQSETQFAWSLCELARYDDHIALNSLKEFGHGGMDRWMDIWVMQDEEGTWVKKFKLGSLPGLVWHLGFLNTGKLLMVTDASFPEFLTNHSQLVVYDPYNQEIRELGPKGTGKHFSAGVYYESLVSVKGGKNQRKGKLSEISVKDFLLPDVRSQFVSQLVLMMDPPMWVANPP